MSYDYNDLTKNQPPKQVQDARARRVSQVYQDTQTNTDPNREQPPSQLPQNGGITVTPDVVDELNKALHHLQQVVLKLRGGV